MATFSKRHYEAIAACIHKARVSTLYGRGFGDSANAYAYGIGAVEAEIAAMFRDDNPAFDGERFAQATGMRDKAK